MILFIDLFNLPSCFKTLEDADKAIEDHSLATNASFSVYKTEKGFNLKGMQFSKFRLIVWKGHSFTQFP